jgi:hypothetical protein
VASAGIVHPLSRDGGLHEGRSRGCTAAGFRFWDGTMTPYERKDPPREPQPRPRDTRAKWLFLAIAILLGLIVSRLLNRLLL